MRVCAILSSYNECDILEESISFLIKEGIDIYLLDNNSTDSCLEIGRKYMGRGVVGCENICFYEGDREIYDWEGILERKTQLAKDLKYDWYIHADADEIRMSPWMGIKLVDAIKRVDDEGYNLINFKLFNFRLYENVFPEGLVSSRLVKYSNAEKYNQMQIKAWKAHSEVDLVTHGGHKAIVPDPKIYPMRFILKHYPIRSLEQGVRKINNERKSRFSIGDRKRNWHIQYDHYSVAPISLQKELLWNENDLKNFILEDEQSAIENEMNLALKWAGKISEKLYKKRDGEFYLNYLQFLGPEAMYSDIEIMEVLKEINGLLHDDEALFFNAMDSISEDVYLFNIIKLEASLCFLEGSPRMLESLVKISND